MSGDFGYHNDPYLVSLCTICAEIWHYTPLETLAQPESMLLDMIARVNLKDAVERIRDDDPHIHPTDVLAMLETMSAPDPFDDVQAEMRTLQF